MAVTVTSADIQNVIRGIDQIEWTAYMDRAWYPLAPQDWQEEQCYLAEVRRCMPWGSTLWLLLKLSYGQFFHMSRGPTYDFLCKLLARKLLSNSKDSSNAAEERERLPQRLRCALPD